jgi:hypothetical protein
MSLETKELQVEYHRMERWRVDKKIVKASEVVALTCVD